MSLTKTVQKARNTRLTMRGKLRVSLLSIAAVLLISCIISVMEYSRMSSYVSDLVADDISSINVARKLADMTNTYNLEILAVIGDDTSAQVPDFDDDYFRSHCSQLTSSIGNPRISALADSVMYSYSAYRLTSLELGNVLMSDFIDSRSWYFERLQPRANRLRIDIDNLSNAIHDDLQTNSATFERGLYRSMVPGIVAVGVGMLLLLMLLFFLMVFYAKPIYKMLKALNAYRSADLKYTYRFDGDDQLRELNDGITELANENQQLRRRILAFRNKDNK